MKFCIFIIFAVYNRNFKSIYIHIGNELLIQCTCLFCSDFILVVVEIFSTKQKRELWIIFLFLLGHVFKLWSISCNKLSQFINDVLEVMICGSKVWQCPIFIIIHNSHFSMKRCNVDIFHLLSHMVSYITLHLVMTKIGTMYSKSLYQIICTFCYWSESW